MKRIKLFFNWLYILNHYWGCEKITLWDYFYRKRTGIKTAWRIAKHICDNK